MEISRQSLTGVDQVSMKHFVCFSSLADHAALGWLRIRV